MNLIFATTNELKFQRLSEALAPHNIVLTQQPIETEELQINDGEELARRKAEDAYVITREPTLVTDDCWEIPALRGFPGPNMKQCNEYLSGEDWLRLMDGVEDRRIFMIQNIAYTDGTNTFVMPWREEYHFLHDVQGEYTKSPHLTVISWKGDTQSVALQKDRIGKGEEHLKPFWGKLANKLKTVSS